MKKMVVGLLAAGLVLGAGTAAVFAEGNGDGEGTINFGQMLPFMKKMHPDLSEQQLKDMYNSCHGTGGTAPGKDSQPVNPQTAPQSMMNL